MIRVYKRKLILTKEQTKRIGSWIGACRVVYNLGMEIKNASYKTLGKSIHKFELMKQLPSLRKDIEWIKDVPADALIQTIHRLDNSYKNFFRTYKNGGGYPKFASKKTFKSISLKQSRGLIKIIGSSINLNKIGKLKMFKDSPVVGDIKNVHIIKEPTGYFACIQCENVPTKFVSESQVIGLDMGLSHFCVDSNGNFISNPQHFKKYERQLRIENRSLARKKKGSNSWKKQCKRLSFLHHKIVNVRRDYLHKESTKIAKSYRQVYIEDLNIKGMVKNRNLSKYILDASWGVFKTMLEYKTSVISVNPKHTSQTCNECGEVDSKSRISQSEFVCTNCGHISNADVNAAKNILSKGIALDRKREPVGCALVLEGISHVSEG